MKRPPCPESPANITSVFRLHREPCVLFGVKSAPDYNHFLTLVRNYQKQVQLYSGPFCCLGKGPIFYKSAKKSSRALSHCPKKSGGEIRSEFCVLKLFKPFSKKIRRISDQVALGWDSPWGAGGVPRYKRHHRTQLCEAVGLVHWGGGRAGGT